ncbi:MAG: hypothetical protein DRJ10_20365 [Bacteroidetes bacterium]|nr:MAG: hypothetical protein DRJ10_20365 [Bacteroidota bacterium]
MAIPSLFKLPANKNFDLKTRYYDAEKEELEQRVERAKRDAGLTGAINDKGAYVPNIKGQMRHSIESRPSIAEESSIISRRWLVITIILTLIVYGFYKFNYIALFIEDLINRL